jgi:hypothetical protein
MERNFHRVTQSLSDAAHGDVTQGYESAAPDAVPSAKATAKMRAVNLGVVNPETPLGRRMSGLPTMVKLTDRAGFLSLLLFVLRAIRQVEKEFAQCPHGDRLQIDPQRVSDIQFAPLTDPELCARPWTEIEVFLADHAGDCHGRSVRRAITASKIRSREPCTGIASRSSSGKTTVLGH